MKLRVLCVGRLSEPYLRDGCALFQERLRHYLPLAIEEIKEHKPATRGDLDRAFTTSNRVNTFVPTEQEDVWGWQAGGGLEYRVLKGVRVGAQYQFTRLDDKTRYTVRSQGPAPATNPFILTNPAGTDLRRSDDFEFQTVRFTATYRF